MKVLIDADACPVVDIAVTLCKAHGISCLLLCDTAHTMHRDGAETLVFDKGSDSVDFALVNRTAWPVPHQRPLQAHEGAGCRL